MEVTMENWSPQSAQDGYIQPPVGVDAQDRFGGAIDDFHATLLAMASHDLRQPLQVIVGAHDRLAGSLDGPERAALARAERATMQMTDTLDHLIDALRFG